MNGTKSTQLNCSDLNIFVSESNQCVQIRLIILILYYLSSVNVLYAIFIAIAAAALAIQQRCKIFTGRVDVSNETKFLVVAVFAVSLFSLYACVLSTALAHLKHDNYAQAQTHRHTHRERNKQTRRHIQLCV